MVGGSIRAQSRCDWALVVRGDFIALHTDCRAWPAFDMLHELGYLGMFSSGVRLRA